MGKDTTVEWEDTGVEWVEYKIGSSGILEWSGWNTRVGLVGYWSGGGGILQYIGTREGAGY